jgi:hypothetical protein
LGEREDDPARDAHDCEPREHQPERSPHVLGHTFSVTASQKGISLPTLQRLPGYDHLAATQNLSAEHVIKEFIDKWWNSLLKLRFVCRKDRFIMWQT